MQKGSMNGDKSESEKKGTSLSFQPPAGDSGGLFGKPKKPMMPSMPSM